MASSPGEICKENGYSNEAFELENTQCGHQNSDVSSFKNRKSSSDFDARAKISISTSPKKSSEVMNSREEWGGGLSFLMACISTSVGLGNVWRFPFTAYENGGGAFLIPYIIVLFLVGKPFYFLEAFIGQFTNKSCTKCWEMVPAMKGIGYGQAFVASFVVSYYCSLMALTVYYFCASFQSELPWAYCRDEWENECIDAFSSRNITNDTNQKNLRSSAELYFRRIVLNEQISIEDGIGIPSWELSLCLLAAWISIFVVLYRGVQCTGKAMYFLAIFPYVVMIALLVRAVTLDGAIGGILFFVTPKWNMLLKPTVWYAAITQCFFSLSVCFGPILTYSSYNNFNHKLIRDVTVITSLDTMTSFMAGCTIFGILGNLAHEMGTTDVSAVVRGGTGLAFISYPDALARFTVLPQLFSVFFFVMMFVLGTGSAVALCASILAILQDLFPKAKQWQLVLLIVIIGYAISHVYITPGGQWFVNLIDYYAGTSVAIIIAVLEIITVFWAYGLTNFLNDAEFMLGSRPNFYWRFCWVIVTPLLMIIVLIYTIATYQPLTYDNMQFPDYAYGIGWFILVLGVFPIFGYTLYKLIINRSSSVRETFRRAFQPCKEKWGPTNLMIRKEWRDFITERKLHTQKGFREMFFK